MSRRHIFTERQRAALFDLPTDELSLLKFYTLGDDDLENIRQRRRPENRIGGTVAKLAMRQPFVLFKGLTFQKLCLPGAFRPGDHHNKMLRPGLCVVHASPQYL
ncbi:DUF4158 domain-containing protein (plasmid) [Escherichia coli]